MRHSAAPLACRVCALRGCEGYRPLGSSCPPLWLWCSLSHRRALPGSWPSGGCHPRTVLQGGLRFKCALPPHPVLLAHTDPREGDWHVLHALCNPGGCTGRGMAALWGWEL